MSTTPFELNGEKARWRLAYEALLKAGVEYGREIAYAELAALFGMAVEVFLRSRGPLYRVIRELEVEHGRTLLAVPGRGYRVSYPAEHAGVCSDRRRRGRRLTRRAVNLIESTDLDALDAGQREELKQVKAGLVLALGVLTVHERRITRMEDALRRAGLL